MTDYIVFDRLADRGGTEGDYLWRELGRADSRSAKSAIQKVLEDIPPDETEGATFVAVPARSWKPVTVKVETKTALKFS